MEPGKTILVFETDVNLGRAMGMALARAGYEVLLPADSQEALALVRQRAGEIDLFILGMPTTAALELMRASEAHHGTAHLPLLLCTAQSPEEIAKGMETGAADYVSKPFSLSHLLFRVKVLLERTLIRTSPMLAQG